MKVLYLTTGCFDKGGISRYNRYQITALREIFGEDNVRVLSLWHPREGDFEEPFVVYWYSNGIGLRSNINFALKVFKESLNWRPEIILTGHVNFSGLAVMAAKFSGSLTLLNTYGLEVWSGLTKDADWGLKKSDYVISDCHYTARYLEHEGMRRQGSVKVICDCVDLLRFNPDVKIPLDLLEKYGIPDPHKYKLIVSLGRISKNAAHKGYDRLIQAFTLIHSKHPEARLVLAGKGDLVDQLKSLAAKCGVLDKVTFTGMVDEKDLPAIYQIAYVFSLVSDRGKGRGEGIPLTPLEAMACGVPIIVGNQDGSQEAVVDDKNGFVIDPFEIGDHARTLDLLLSDPPMRHEKAEHAVSIARDNFSYVHFKAKHKELLTRLILSN